VSRSVWVGNNFSMRQWSVLVSRNIHICNCLAFLIRRDAPFKTTKRAENLEWSWYVPFICLSIYCMCHCCLPKIEEKHHIAGIITGELFSRNFSTFQRFYCTCLIDFWQILAYEICTLCIFSTWYNTYMCIEGKLYYKNLYKLWKW